MKMPIRRIGARIERVEESEVDKDSNEDHAAIGADALQIRLIMIRRPAPRPRLGDETRAGRGDQHYSDTAFKAVSVHHFSTATPWAVLYRMK